MTQIPTIYGDRICKRCKGLCHTDSWRTTYKQHNIYFCCEAHLRAEYGGFIPPYYQRVNVKSK